MRFAFWKEEEWKRRRVSTANSEYEVLRNARGFAIKKIGGKLNSPNNRGMRINQNCEGDEIVLRKGRSLVLKREGKIVLTTSVVTAIF